MQIVYEKLGKNIRQARLRAGLTQEQLAKVIGLTRTSVNNIEHGRQKLLVHTLIDIANACNISPAILLVPKDEDANVPSDVSNWLERLRTTTYVNSED